MAELVNITPRGERERRGAPVQLAVERSAPIIALPPRPAPREGDVTLAALRRTEATAAAWLNHCRHARMIREQALALAASTPADRAARLFGRDEA